MKFVASNHLCVVNHTVWYQSENSQAYRDDFRLQIIAILLVSYFVVAPCVCFCAVTWVKKLTMCQCERSANLVFEGL